MSRASYQNLSNICLNGKSAKISKKSGNRKTKAKTVLSLAPSSPTIIPTPTRTTRKPILRPAY